MAKIFITSLFFLSVIFPSVGYAEDYVGSGNPKDEDFQLVPCKGVDCDFNALMTLINRVINFILYVSIPLAAISFSYAGYLYLSAAGNTSKIEEAHKIFGKVLIGFVFILSAWLIVYAITNSLLDSDFKNSKGNLLRNGGSGSGSGSGYGGGGGGGNSSISESGEKDLLVLPSDYDPLKNKSGGDNPFDLPSDFDPFEEHIESTTNE